MKRDIHPAPAERWHTKHGRKEFGYPTGESMSRDQNIRRESLDRLNVELPIQDVERLLAGDPDPELRERVADRIAGTLEDLYEYRDFG